MKLSTAIFQFNCDYVIILSSVGIVQNEIRYQVSGIII